MPKKLTALCVIVSLTIGTASCATTGTGVIDACRVWRPVSWSAKDTPQTIVDVKGNNVRRGAFCK
jgi:hypothetical protein